MRDIKEELTKLQKLFLESQEIAEFRQKLLSDCLSGVIMSISVLADKLNNLENFDAKDFSSELRKISSMILKTSENKFDSKSTVSSVMVKTAASVDRVLVANAAKNQAEEYSSILNGFDIQDQKSN